MPLDSAVPASASPADEGSNDATPPVSPALANGTNAAIVTAGAAVGQVNVSIGPQFLQLFSEQLYSSPNKAFEELVSNAWDAGATAVYIGMPADLDTSHSAVWVLDNGESMDLNGIELLWAVAHSTKPTRQNVRPQIGKFGIGKLSTYLLADQLTYVCKAADGVIRAVTMDYRRISAAGGDKLHIEPLPLDVRELSETDLEKLLADLDDKYTILDLIRKNVPKQEMGNVDEFGQGNGGSDPSTPSGTWTLAIMTSLKDAGRRMESGRIRRMLRTALPLGNTISISFNLDPLVPTKLDIEVSKQWKIGPDLEIEQIELPPINKSDEPRVFIVEGFLEPYPHVQIEGVPGRITGSLRLFAEPISGGKSSKVAQSNGFFINILGRVVNPDDSYFGLTNLNHSAWAKMRAAVRADGLNAAVSVDRESVNDALSVLIFRAYLRAMFNKVRSEHDASTAAAWPKAGEILTKRWGTVPLGPLRRLVGDRTTSEGDVPSFFLVPDGEGNWPLDGAPQPDTDLVEDVLIEGLGPDSWLVRYDPNARQVLVNSDHPFAREYANTHEQQLLLRDASFAELLTQAYMTDVGLADDTITQIAEYRDQVLRLVARIRRRSAIQLAEILATVTNDKDALEHALTESLEYLGYVVDYISGSGEPEGVASAPITPNERGERRTYTFTYDAKSSKTGKAENGDVRVSTLVRHREKYGANHALVVAPDFAEGALNEECQRHQVTPMRASDLAGLLVLQGTSGPLPLELLREVFDIYDPNSVHEWVVELPARLNSSPRISFAQLFEALVSIGYQEPDTLTMTVIAREIRASSKSQEFPKSVDVSKVINGLSVMVPDLVRATGEQVFLGAEPATIRDVVLKLLSDMPERLKFQAVAQSGD